MLMKKPPMIARLISKRGERVEFIPQFKVRSNSRQRVTMDAPSLAPPESRPSLYSVCSQFSHCWSSSLLSLQFNLFKNNSKMTHLLAALSSFLVWMSVEAAVVGEPGFEALLAQAMRKGIEDCPSKMRVVSTFTDRTFIRVSSIRLLNASELFPASGLRDCHSKCDEEPAICPAFAYYTSRKMCSLAEGYAETGKRLLNTAEINRDPEVQYWVADNDLDVDLPSCFKNEAAFDSFLLQYVRPWLFSDTTLPPNMSPANHSTTGAATLNQAASVTTSPTPVGSTQNERSSETSPTPVGTTQYTGTTSQDSGTPTTTSPSPTSSSSHTSGSPTTTVPERTTVTAGPTSTKNESHLGDTSTVTQTKASPSGSTTTSPSTSGAAPTPTTRAERLTTTTTTTKAETSSSSSSSSPTSSTSTTPTSTTRTTTRSVPPASSSTSTMSDIKSSPVTTTSTTSRTTTRSVPPTSSSSTTMSATSRSTMTSSTSTTTTPRSTTTRERIEYNCTYWTLNGYGVGLMDGDVKDFKRNHTDVENSTATSFESEKPADTTVDATTSKVNGGGQEVKNEDKHGSTSSPPTEKLDAVRYSESSTDASESTSETPYYKNLIRKVELMETCTMIITDYNGTEHTVKYPGREVEIVAREAKCSCGNITPASATSDAVSTAESMDPTTSEGTSTVAAGNTSSADATTEPLPDERTSTAEGTTSLSPGSNVSCSRGRCTCGEKEDLRANWTSSWASAMTLEKEGAGNWNLFGEMPSQKLHIAAGAVLATCHPSIRVFSGPTCPVPVLVKGYYEAKRMRCAAGTTFLRGEAADGSGCEKDAILGCLTTGFYCTTPFTPSVIHCE